MKTLTATLEAAQKKAHRLPYVEAVQTDYERRKGCYDQRLALCAR